MRDFVLIDMINNIIPETDKAFLYLFLEYTWNELTAKVVIQGFDERGGMLQADEEVLQIR